jgi:hypothetical protein
MFSFEVRQHGSWICVRCRRDFSSRRHMLDASHFFNKDECTAVRYDPRNVDPLCRECHTGKDGWEYQKAGDYMVYMFKKLGHDGYGELRSLAMSRMKSEDARLQLVHRMREGTLWIRSSELTLVTEAESSY